MTKPSIFKLGDALTFGLAALGLTVLAVIAGLRPDNAPIAKLTLALVALVSWAPYVFLLYRRWKVIAKISFVTKHGLYVCAGEYIDFFPRDIVEAEVDRVLNAWLASGLTYDYPKIVGRVGESLKGWTLLWAPRPFKYGASWYNGFVRQHYKEIRVGFSKPIESTALAHELAHVIYGYCTGIWTEGAGPEYARTHGIPC